MVVALAIIGADLFGWNLLLRPIAQLVRGQAAVAMTTEQLAVVALATLIFVKWTIAVVLAAAATQS